MCGTIGLTGAPAMRRVVAVLNTALVTVTDLTTADRIVTVNLERCSSAATTRARVSLHTNHSIVYEETDSS